MLTYCEEQHRLQHDVGRAFGLSWDWFGRSSSPQNHALTQHFADVLEDQGLIEERLDAFRSTLSNLKPQDSLDYRIADLADVDPAEAILKLRICDPAMGSGHFLVSLVDTLADHVLDAMAEAAVLAGDIGYASLSGSPMTRS